MKKLKTPLLVILVLLIAAAAGGGAYYFMKYRQAGLESASKDAPTGDPATAAGATAPVGDTAGTAGAGGGQAAPPGNVVTPDLTVDSNGLSKSTVLVKTTKGDVRFKFFPKDAPNTVNRIVELIQKGFYNGLTFHRVVPGFVVQGGDPEGTGAGGSGQVLKAEFNERKHIEGTVAMARASDPDSADSQFYIALGPQPHLDRSYTVFGKAISGLDIIHKLQVGDKMTAVTIETVEIWGSFGRAKLILGPRRPCVSSYCQSFLILAFGMIPASFSVFSARVLRVRTQFS